MVYGEFNVKLIKYDNDDDRTKCISILKSQISYLVLLISFFIIPHFFYDQMARGKVV